MKKDGPRYVVCVQKKDDLVAFTFEYQTEVLKEAKNRADELFRQHKEKLKVHVLDREMPFNDPHRLEPVVQEIEEEEEQPQRRRRKK